MNRELSPEQLDCEIEQMMHQMQGTTAAPGPLLEIAAGLQLLPSQEFRERLRNELLEKAGQMEEVSRIAKFEFPRQDPALMQTLAGRRYSALPADPRSLFFSFLSHAAAVVLIASGIWMSSRPIVKPTPLTRDLAYIPLPLGDSVPHGGGSGGDHSTTQASRGTPPKFSDEQLAPPVIVVPNDAAKLQVQPTVLGPPQIKLPQSDRIGDLMSHNVVIPSNGTGSRGGMGSNSGTGIGDDGTGGGVGPGGPMGFGGKTFRPGNGVSAPRAIYEPDPEYSDEARRVKHQGTVMLSLVVDASGRPQDIHIVRSLGMGLDEKATEAVQKWQFAPGMKDGHAVAVLVNVEVNFRLY